MEMWGQKVSAVNSYQVLESLSCIHNSSCSLKTIEKLDVKILLHKDGNYIAWYNTLIQLIMVFIYACVRERALCYTA